jgi:hypothetical protein
VFWARPPSSSSLLLLAPQSSSSSPRRFDFSEPRVDLMLSRCVRVSVCVRARLSILRPSSSSPPRSRYLGSIFLGRPPPPFLFAPMRSRGRKKKNKTKKRQNKIGCKCVKKRRLVFFSFGSRRVSPSSTPHPPPPPTSLVKSLQSPLCSRKERRGIASRPNRSPPFRARPALPQPTPPPSSLRLLHPRPCC